MMETIEPKKYEMPNLIKIENIAHGYCTCSFCKINKMSQRNLRRFGLGKYEYKIKHKMRVKCSLCNDSFPNDQDLVIHNGQKMKLIEVRKLMHEEFKHPESKNVFCYFSNRNVIPKYGRKIEWIMINDE